MVLMGSQTADRLTQMEQRAKVRCGDARICALKEFDSLG